MKQLFVYGENSRHPHTMEISEKTSIQDIINKFIAQHQVSAVEEEPYQLHERERGNWKSNGDIPDFQDKHRVQCHRCSHIDITFRYQHHEHQAALNPAFTGARILAELPKYFPGLTPKEAANLRLMVGEDVFIDQDDHVGSFVEYPHCHLQIEVVPKKNING